MRCMRCNAPAVAPNDQPVALCESCAELHRQEAEQPRPMTNTEFAYLLLGTLLGFGGGVAFGMYLVISRS